ncbi:MAG: hypothetical protein CME35_10915 [Gramella sp.]|nr:hypothetical protein [Christiangramia sp.]
MKNCQKIKIILNKIQFNRNFIGNLLLELFPKFSFLAKNQNFAGKYGIYLSELLFLLFQN